MKILLLGEYSNVHHTLCQSLRRQGHEVLLISDGDGWKDYPRDVDLRRRRPGPLGSLCYLWRLATLLPRMRGYDVVQLINPVFLDVRPHWSRWVFHWLRRHNGIVSLGCFGDDYYVIRRMSDPACFAYSDLQAYGRPIQHDLNRHRAQVWLQGPKAQLTRHIAQRAHCLVACLYEYWLAYSLPEFLPRLHYVPLPVVTAPSVVSQPHSPVRVLFAAQRQRALIKGTDVIEPLLDRLAQRHPASVILTKVTSVPFAEFRRLVAEADVVVDQLYSYTPAMGALESLSQGKVVIGGYEDEYVGFLQSLQSADAPQVPAESGIINVRPDDPEGNYALLERLLTDAQTVARLQQAAVAFVRRFHDADAVARSYLSVWSSAMGVGEGSSSSSLSSHR